MVIKRGVSVLDRGGHTIGVMTGGNRQCIAGCKGVKFGVRWPDGKLTWVCTTDVIETTDGVRLTPNTDTTNEAKIPVS